MTNANVVLVSMNIVELAVTDVSANGALEERHGERQRNLVADCRAAKCTSSIGSFTAVLLREVFVAYRDAWCHTSLLVPRFSREPNAFSEFPFQPPRSL